MNIRRSQPGDYHVLQSVIDKLQKEHADLERQHTDTTTALGAELAKDAQWFNESDVFEHRHNLAQIEQRRELVVDRIAALEGRLPTPKQRRDAKREGQSLFKAADEAGQRFTDGWRRLVEALEAASAIGAELTAARTDARAALYSLADLVAEHGLTIVVPKLPGPPANEAKYAGLLGSQLRDVGYSGEADTTIERDLAAERRRRVAS